MCVSLFIIPPKPTIWIVMRLQSNWPNPACFHKGHLCLLRRGKQINSIYFTTARTCTCKSLQVCRENSANNPGNTRQSREHTTSSESLGAGFPLGKGGLLFTMMSLKPLAGYWKEEQHSDWVTGWVGMEWLCVAPEPPSLPCCGCCSGSAGPPSAP